MSARLITGREQWRAHVTARCMFNASLLGIVPRDTRELGKLPGNVIQVAQAKVHELTADAVRMELASEPEQTIVEYVETEIWQLLRAFKPAHLPALGSRTTYRHM